MTGLKKDPGFDINRTKEYKLSIQVSLDGFSFSIIHAQKKQLLALDWLSIELSSSRFLGRRVKDWVQKNELLQADFHSTTLIYYPENLTFIPSEIYEYSQQEVVGKLVFGNQNGNLFTDNYLENAHGNLVFPVSKNLSEELKLLFPGKKLLHPVTILDNELSKLSTEKENTLALYFGKNSFTLVLYSNSKIKAINNFSYTSSGDVVYYTVAAVKKLKLVPEKTTLYLAGELIPNGKIHDNMKKIFSSTIFFAPEVRYNPYIFKEPLHRFIVLF